MFWLVQLLVPVCVAVVLPVLIVWIVFRSVSNKDNKNAEVIIKAIENNSSIDADRMVEALGKRQKSPLQVLQLRLLRGCIFAFTGIAFAIFSAIMHNMAPQYPECQGMGLSGLMIACVALPIGLAYLIVYFLTRKSVKAECEK